MSKQVTIIGGGIIGLCSAYYAVKRGFDVTIIDRNNEGDDNCSNGNAGMIVPSHFVPLAAPGMVGMGLKMMTNPRSPFAFHIPPSINQMLWSWQFMRHANAKHVADSEIILRDLNLTSRKLYEQLTEDIGVGYQFVKKGLVMLCKKAETLEHEAHVAKRANELGVGASVHDVLGLKYLDPDLTLDVVGGVHFHDDCHLSPTELLAALRTKLTDLGVKFIFNTACSRIETKQDQVEIVDQNGAVIECDQVVIAGGVESRDLANQIGLKLPMMAGKGYSMMVTNPAERPDLCYLLAEARVAVTPMQQGVRFGGTMELGEPNHNINRDRIQGIIDSIPQFMPKFQPSHFKDLPVWHGWRPCSPDGLPYVGRMKRNSKVVIATGHSMMGLSLGPVTGMLVSEILADAPTTLPINQLDPNRYA